MAKNCCEEKNTCGCRKNDFDDHPQEEAKKKLIISWQRLVYNEDTCPRCGATENELNKAMAQLKEELNPRGIDVVLEKRELTLEEFKQSPEKSNRILFNGRLLEDLLKAKTGQSSCCGVCGDNECRTVELDGNNYEAIPATLIVEAGMRAIS